MTSSSKRGWVWSSALIAGILLLTLSACGQSPEKGEPASAPAAPAAGPHGEGYSQRADLSQPLAPGQSATLTAEVTAPNQPGDYEIQLDLVHETITWFEWKGAPKLVVKLKVT